MGERKIKFAASGPQPRPILLRVIGKLGGYKPHPMIEHFKFLQGAHAADAEADHSVAVIAAFPLRPRCGAGIDLSVDGRFLSRSRPDRTAKWCAPSPTPAAAICSSTRSTSPICAIRRCARSIADRGEDPAALPGDLCRHDQRRDFRHSARHDHHHASVPRQFPLELRRQRRLRAGGGVAVQHDQRARLFHGIRHRARRRLRAAALRAEGQDRRARARHHQDPARWKRRTRSSAASSRRRNSSISISSACRRNAASPRPRRATSWPRRRNGRSCAMIVEIADEVWGMKSHATNQAAVPRRSCRQPVAARRAESRRASAAPRARSTAPNSRRWKTARSRTSSASRKRSACNRSPTANSAARGGISTFCGGSTASSATSWIPASRLPR